MNRDGGENSQPNFNGSTQGMRMSSVILSKPGTGENEHRQLMTLSKGAGTVGKPVKMQVKRTSDLQAPNMLLTGHEGEVLSCKFSPSGEHLASSSTDRAILLWNTFGECKNYGILRPHTNAILEIEWSIDGERIFSASADKAVGITDATNGQSIKKFKEHTGIVNSIASKSRYSGGADIIASGSDDGYILVWDSREKRAVSEIEYKYPVTSVCYSLTGDILYTGSVDNKICAWDTRNNSLVYTLEGHTDTVTGLCIAESTGNHLLSNSMDSQVRLWDTRPFCSIPTRCERVFVGAPLGFGTNLVRPAFSKDETRVACGGADRYINIWNVRTGEIVYRLPGHKGTVNQVDFHPKQPILLSASSDKSLLLGELDSVASIVK